MRTVESLAEVPVEALEQYDVVVASSRDECPALSRLQPAAVFASEEERAGGGVFVFRPDVPGWRPAPRPALSASAPGQDAAYDGRSETNWSAPAGSGWIEARWTSPVRVARVEVEVADEQWPQPLRLAGLIDGEWRRLEAEPLRPARATRQRAGGPHGQVYALVPARELTALRLERDEGRAWNLAELRVLTR